MPNAVSRSISHTSTVIKDKFQEREWSQLLNPIAKIQNSCTHYDVGMSVT
jgi:hypothetical protein